MMRRLVLSFVLLCSLLGIGTVASPAPVSAQFDLFPCEGESGNSSVCKDSKKTDNPIYGSGGIVGTVVNILSLIIGVAAVIIIIVAGIQYMLSTGDPTKVNNAKNAILYALVGLIVAVLARFVVPFIVGKL